MTIESRWTREQSLVVLNLYCQLPFGKLHHRNPDVIRCAELIGRSPNAVAMKLSNFASLDPAITSTGRIGLANASNSDREMWAQMQADWGRFAEQAERAAADLGVSAVDAPPDVSDELEIAQDYTGHERPTQVAVRIGQYSFRQTVLSAYDYRCCVSGLAVPQLLVASHIKPWRDDLGNRLNPRNGLCLSALHDRAFDAGIFTIASEMTVTISRKFREASDPFFESTLSAFEGQAIHLPKKFQPAEECATSPFHLAPPTAYHSHHQREAPSCPNKNPEPGGRRPGAGAPRGNLNALKHGRRSQQFARIGALFAGEPKLREVILLLGQRHNLQRRQDNQEAAAIFVHLLEAMQRKTNRSFDLGHSDDWRSIKEEVAVANLEKLQKRLAKHARLNQQSKPNPDPTAQSAPTHTPNND